MFSMNYFIPIAPVFMVASCGSYLTRMLKDFVLLGEKVYGVFGNFLTTRTAVSYRLLVNAYLFLMSCVAGFLILLALVLYTSALLFASLPIMESYTLAAGRQLGKIFCIVSNDIIVPIIIFFLVQSTE